MKRERKIIVYIATSADGYIARADGSVDWLNRPRPPGNYGMGEFFRSIDTILWGRKTYDQARMRGEGGGFGPKVKNYVFSHRPPESPVPNNVEFVNEPISAFAKHLRAVPGKNIWMMGGGGVIASFLDEGQIDEFIIHVVPQIIDGVHFHRGRHSTPRSSSPWRSVDLDLLSELPGWSRTPPLFDLRILTPHIEAPFAPGTIPDLPSPD